ncbi:hypothetical protein BGZ47_007040 [Haplosporangium gracile]|nr:hypothetical protein BGZ47_007040 [Haplosporangium gracile]
MYQTRTYRSLRRFVLGEFLIRSGSRSRSYAGVVPTPVSFLRRCRSLESVFMLSLDKGMFKRAVQERKDFEDVAVALGGDRAVAKTSKQRSLVPLREYHALCNWASSGGQISDVIYAFNKSLEDIKVKFYGGRSATGPQSFSDVVVGRRIEDEEKDDNEEDIVSSFSSSSYSPSLPHLPRLRSIAIATEWMTLQIHPMLFAQSPSLIYVILDYRQIRDSLAHTVVYWKPAELPHLTNVILTSTPTISFHSETVRGTRNLNRLELRVYAFQNGPLAPIAVPEDDDDDDDELTAVGQDQADNTSAALDGTLTFSSSATTATLPVMQRLVWTWDWDLPNLTYLCMVSEFAYKFQYRMLDGTSNLNHLSLNLRCVIGRGPDRTISIEELLKPRSQQPLLPQFLGRDQQHCKKRRQLISCRVEDDAICKQQKEKESKDRDEDERLWHQEFEFLQLPKLRALSLIGPWVLQYRELIQSTAENLHELSLCVTTIPFNLELVTEAGLVDDPGYSWKLIDDGWRMFVIVERPTGRVLDTPVRYRLQL